MLTRAPARPAGFSLVELMVVIAVVGLLLLAAVPSFGTWSADARIRSAAESLQNGLRLAQGEALQRNRRSAFALTADAPTLQARPAANGGNWFVRTLLLDGSGESDDPAKDAAAARRLIDGGHVAASNVNITGPALLCFGPLGRLVELDSEATGLDVACQVDEPVVYVVSAPVVGSRTLQVRVQRGGRVRMCDPARALSEDDPDGC